jgi:hypothetical protein
MPCRDEDHKRGDRSIDTIDDDRDCLDGCLDVD